MQIKHMTRNILIAINLTVRSEPLVPTSHFFHAMQSVFTEVYKVLEVDPKTTCTLGLLGKWPRSGLFNMTKANINIKTCPRRMTPQATKLRAKGQALC